MDLSSLRRRVQMRRPPSFGGAMMWRTRWAGVRRWIDGARERIADGERRRLQSHAVALGAVAVAVLVKYLFAVPETPTPFLLYAAAIAYASSRGEWAAGAVATLASLLVARTTSDVPLSASLWFCVDGFVVSALVARLATALDAERRRVTAADALVRELKAFERDGQIVRAAFGSFDAASVDEAVVILDARGRIADWRAGATRLYGPGVGIIGASAASLFASGAGDPPFLRLLADARNGGTRYSGRQRREDGTEFDATVEISPLSRGGADGFAMIVHDLTRQRAWEAFAKTAADTHTELREEAKAVQSQLATLQHLSDPLLNALAGPDVVNTLLDRLRTAVGADGIALVQAGRIRPRTFCAPGGLQCEPVFSLRRADVRAQPLGRTMLIHNDAAKVSEMSAVRWPDDVSSMIAVPVVRAGATQAVIEVVNLRGRFATDWELALIQVVAARLGGLIREDAYAEGNVVVSP